MFFVNNVNLTFGKNFPQDQHSAQCSPEGSFWAQGTMELVLVYPNQRGLDKSPRALAIIVLMLNLVMVLMFCLSCYSFGFLKKSIEV